MAAMRMAKCVGYVVGNVYRRCERLSKLG